MKIYPSIMAFSPERFSQCIELAAAYGDGIHIDLIDRPYVKPTMAFLPEIHRLLKATGFVKPRWYHIMAQDYRSIVDQLMRHIEHSSTVTVQWEDLDATLDGRLRQGEQLSQDLRSRDILFGIALGPHTPLEQLRPALSWCDDVTIMGVVPGASGQPMLPDTMERVARVAALLKDRPQRPTLSLDGGATPEVVRAHTSDIQRCVVGSYLAEAKSMSEMIRRIVMLSNATGI